MAADETSLDRWARLVMQLGVPTVFAGVLLWFVLTKVATVLDAIVMQMTQQTQALQNLESHISAREAREQGRNP